MSFVYGVPDKAREYADALRLRDWHLSDDAGHPDLPYPTEDEMHRGFAQLEEEPPVTQTPQPHGLGFPENEPEEEP